MLVPKFILYYPQIWEGGRGQAGGVSLLQGLVVASLRINQIYKKIDKVKAKPYLHRYHFIG